MYNCKILLAGLFIDFNLPFLVASLDDLNGNDAIEFKFPYSSKDIFSDDD